MVNDLVSYWGPRAKYVDDLTVMEIVPRNSPSIMRNIVDNINRFVADSHMRLNPKKCKSMEICFLQYNSYSCPHLAAGGYTIERVKSYKFIGVLISSDLSWGSHSDYIIKKTNRRLYALRQLKRSRVAACDIISVYCALVRPILEYASVVFANMPKYLSLAIERVQKRALAIVYPHTPYDAARLLT